MSPTGTLSGTLVGSTTSGQITFTGLKIFSRGTFYIVAFNSIIGTITSSSSATIVNFVHSMTLTASNAAPSAYFNFILTTTLYGEDNNLFTGTCLISFTEASSASFYPSSTISTSTGTAALTVYMTSTGSKTITATCPSSGSSSVSTSVSLTILSEILKITSINPTVISIKPITSSNIFAVTVAVYDYSGTTIESLRGVYSITLSLTPSGSFSGTLTGSTTSGQYTFTGLTVLSKGTFTIVASSAGITSDTSQTIMISNAVSSVSLSSSTLTPSAYFDFTITTTIKGNDNNLYTDSCTITLSESGGSAILGNTIATTSNGTAYFYIYFASIGSKIILATVSGTTGSLGITVQTNNLKIISLTPTVRNILANNKLDSIFNNHRSL